MKLTKIATSEHQQAKQTPFPACFSTSSPASARNSSKQMNTGLIEKKKSTQRLILFRRRSALHRHHAPYPLHCSVRLIHPSDCGLTKLSGGDLHSPSAQQPARSVSPESWLKISSSGTTQRVHDHYMYKNLPSCKVLQTFFANNTHFFKHFQATNNLIPAPSR